MRATGLRGGKPADPSVPSPPPRRSPCSSIRKGVPLYGWKNRGEAPRRWLLSEQRLGGFGPGGGAAQAQAGPPTPRASLPGNGPPPPPLEISGQVHRVPGLLSELREALPATHRTKRFPPWTTRPSSSPTLAEAECPGRTRDVGPGRGAGHGSAPGGAGPGGRIPGQRTGSPFGSLACAPAGRPRALLRLQRPHPATRRQTWTQPLQSSSHC